MSFMTIPSRELDKYMRMPQTVLIDLRCPEEYKRGHIPGAVNVPYDCLESNRLCLLRQKTMILYCERGNLSMQAARKLSEEGYFVFNLYGGIHAYQGKIAVDGP